MVSGCLHRKMRQPSKVLVPFIVGAPVQTCITVQLRGAYLIIQQDIISTQSTLAINTLFNTGILKQLVRFNIATIDKRKLNQVWFTHILVTKQHSTIKNRTNTIVGVFYRQNYRQIKMQTQYFLCPSVCVCVWSLWSTPRLNTPLPHVLCQLSRNLCQHHCSHCLRASLDIISQQQVVSKQCTVDIQGDTIIILHITIFHSTNYSIS